MTSCWRHFSVSVNYGFYRWKHTFDKMFASQQGLWSSKFVQDVSINQSKNNHLQQWPVVYNIPKTRIKPKDNVQKVKTTQR